MKKRVNNFFYLTLIAFSLASLLTFSTPKQPMHAASTGKEIIISLSDQMLYALEDGEEVYETYVTTGQPALPTPTGSFSIFRKQSPMTFYSPWGKSSPYYFPPTNVSYAMEFAGGGYYIHDAPWRDEFGPGTNTAHVEEDSGRDMTGSHGCVNTPIDDAAWLYDWASIGTPVKVVS